MTEFQPRYYQLIGTLPVPCGMWEWARSFEYDRAVRYDEIAGANISTIFLGLDHNYRREGPPILFETMIFPTEIWNYYQMRCSTYEEALAMHRTACDLVRKTQRQLPIVQEEGQ